jgi:hypothetical protein
MSAYICFYFKTKNDTFICLDEFSRSSKMYAACQAAHAPWEQLDPLPKERREEVARNLNDLKDEARANIAELNMELKDSTIFEGLSLDDRMTLRNDFKNEIKEWESDISEIDYALDFLELIGGMHEEEDLSGENQLYFGFEVSGKLENIRKI